MLVSNNYLAHGKWPVKPQGRKCGGLVAGVHTGILMWCSIDNRRILDEVGTFPIEWKGPSYISQRESSLNSLSSLHHVMQISFSWGLLKRIHIPAAVEQRITEVNQSTSITSSSFCTNLHYDVLSGRGVQLGRAGMHVDSSYIAKDSNRVRDQRSAALEYLSSFVWSTPPGQIPKRPTVHNPSP